MHSPCCRCVHQRGAVVADELLPHVLLMQPRRELYCHPIYKKINCTGDVVEHTKAIEIIREGNREKKMKKGKENRDLRSTTNV